MTQNALKRRNSTIRSELGVYEPRSFNAVTRGRFLRDRRRRWRARIEGELSETQAALILSLASLEWSALSAEAEGGLMALREAREHRRLFQRLLADFERSLPVAPEKPDAPTLAELFARPAGEAAA